MNPKKSSLLVFRNHKSNTKLKIMDNEEQNSAKFLGLWFDSMYTFEIHMDKVRQNVVWRISKLKSITRYLTKSNRHEMMYAMCMSVISYGMEIYCRLPGIRKSAQKCQNKINRSILFKPSNFSATDMMTMLDELSIENRYKMSCVLHLYKCLKFDTCQYTLSLMDTRPGSTRLETSFST